MAISKRKSAIKGVADIRTLSGRNVLEQQAYQIYLKLGALEMEKLRRQKEKESALGRINDINHRLQHIDDEIDTLCQSLKQLPAAENRSDDEDSALTSPLAGHKRGFKLRY